MTTQENRAAARLFGPDGLGAKHINLFPGAAPNMSAARVATELNRALDQLEAGQFEVVTP